MPDTDAAMLIDREFLARQTFGDLELASELLGLFADQCRRLLPLIGEAARPVGERADFAHTLKGSALGVGAGRVAARASAVEDALRAGDAAVSTEALSEAVADTLAALPATF